MIFTTFRALVFLLLPISFALAAPRIENWNSQIKTSQDVVLTLLQTEVEAARKHFAKLRGCNGALVSTFVSPSSYVSNQKSEFFKVYYQLGYTGDSCSNKLLITCRVAVTSSQGQVSLSRGRCQPYPAKSYDSENSGMNGGPKESPDSTKDSNEDIVDDGLTEPIRGGNDVERGNDLSF